MLLASVFGTVEVTYLATWCLMVAAINALTSWVVIRRFGLIQSAGPLTGWFVFLMLLGPCGLTRLDAVMMPLVMIALAVVSARPALASVLLTSAAWLKVSGGLILAPLFAVAKTWRARLLSVVVPAAATCLAVAIGQHSLGGQWRFWTSFVGAETDRGLQVEAVLATPVVLAHAFRGETIPQWNDELSTWETWGPGAEVAIQVSDIAMPLMVLAIAVLAWLARRRPAEALTVASLALMSGLIVTHKVGSPQFVAWIAPPLVIGLCQGYRLRFWTLLSATGVLAAALTGLLYPWGYGPFLSGDRLWLTIWVVRNLLVVAIFVAATVKLVRLRPHKSADSVGAEPPGEPPPSAVTDQIQGADIIRTPSAPGDRPIGRRDPWMISPTDTHTGCSGTTPIAASSPPSLNGLHSPGRRTRPPRR
jgi:hypothetical protein